MSVVTSIVICTRNRADSLRETLSSIGRCIVPADLPSELLVVDNGSTDHTLQVVEQATLSNMPLRLLLEPRTGQCYARNTGIKQAAGNVILFTDDDVRVPEDWVDGMCRPIVSGRADAVAGGVCLAPSLERPWLVGLLRSMLAVVTPSPTEPPTSLVGANMAFDRRVLQKVPSFDTELGPGASGLGDDTTFGLLLRRNGYRLAWAEGGCVEHHCDISRLTPEYALEWMRRSGRSNAIMSRKWLGDAPSFPLLRWWSLSLKYALRRRLDQPSGQMPPEWQLHYERRIAYYRDLARS